MAKKTKEKRDTLNSGNKSAQPPKWFYFLLIAIPLLFFILLEIGLRVFDYGRDYEKFVTITEAYPDKLFLNPEITGKYFTGLKEAPGTIPDAFDKEKKDDCFRIFVLGGSSAAGWPYVPNGTFSRYLKRKLELLYPENTIEVINCGISAINSYTIRDFIPEIIEQKPDLILVYMGHNEYYGALGVASSVSMGSFRSLVNAYVWLLEFRTTQLVQNIIQWGYGLFADNGIDKDDKPNETLMARMIGESLVPLNSDIFQAGIDQFEGNLEDILNMLSEADIPVILGTLTSNIKDLKPFVSAEQNDMPTAEEIFKSAEEALDNGNNEEAKELFLYAKELDALRFRAPKNMNEIIKNLGKEFNYGIVDIDSVFESKSPNGLVGYNLILDHLHPTLDGYQLIGEEFFKSMNNYNLLPDGKRINMTEEKADSIMNENFPFTRLDSTISYMKLIMLIGGYPFVPKGTPNYLSKNYKLKDFIDTLAVKTIINELLWEQAHVKAAEIFYKKNDYKNFVREVNAIAAERPFNFDTYEYAAQMLIDAEQFNEALSFLKVLDQKNPTYFSNKWLGQILLDKGSHRAALDYLNKASKYPEADWQIWYNLAGAYYLTGQTDRSIAAIEISLKLNPNNSRALNFYSQLKSLK